MKCKRTGILRSEEIAVSPNFKQNVKSFGEQQEDIIILLICVNVMLIICCSRERRSCIAFVQIHFAMNTLVKKSFHNSSPLLLSFTQWSLESGASTLTRRASFSAVSQLFSFFLLLSASSVASQTESSPF